MQDVRFVGSYTPLRREGGEDGQCGRILRELGIDPATFISAPAQPEEEADHIFIMRSHADEPVPDGWAGRAQLHRHVLGFPRGSDRRGAGRMTARAAPLPFEIVNKVPQARLAGSLTIELR